MDKPDANNHPRPSIEKGALAARVGGAPATIGKTVPRQTASAPAEQRQKNGGIITADDALLRQSIANEADWLAALSKRHGCPIADIGGLDLESGQVRAAIAAFPETFCRQRRCLPIGVAGNKIFVAICDPGDIETLDLIRATTGGRIVEPLVSSPSRIEEAITKAYRATQEREEGDDIAATLDDIPETGDVEAPADEEEKVGRSALEREAKDAPIVKLVRFVIASAIRDGASDIHVEYLPGDTVFRIRFRVDGVARIFQSLPKRLLRPFISRVKILAQLNITERRLPQSGRLQFRSGQDVIDLRVESSPVIDGQETAVLRLLSRANLEPDLAKLGMLPKQLEVFRATLERPDGMILVTGPTGSGKTTTLYSALANINKPEVVILTAEDPVEYRLPGIRQLPVNQAIGLTFAEAIRSFLRQDPDVILIGEVRDFETAENALKAAMTGHLVFSTLHTIDAASSVIRLTQMGIEPFLIAGTLRCVTAQRLVRTICSECVAPIEGEELALLRMKLIEAGAPEVALDHAHLQRGRGCNRCGKTGYRGRLALHEVLDLNDGALQSAILNGAATSELKSSAVSRGMRTLWQVGLLRILEGRTTLEEVARVTVRDSARPRTPKP
ncbi:MAG: GspE/PulE family protein [Candidatus Uhrbacteria bacterium]